MKETLSSINRVLIAVIAAALFIGSIGVCFYVMKKDNEGSINPSHESGIEEHEESLLRPSINKGAASSKNSIKTKSSLPNRESFKKNPPKHSQADNLVDKTKSHDDYSDPQILQESAETMISDLKYEIITVTKNTQEPQAKSFEDYQNTDDDDDDISISGSEPLAFIDYDYVDNDNIFVPEPLTYDDDIINPETITDINNEPIADINNVSDDESITDIDDVPKSFW